MRINPVILSALVSVMLSACGPQMVPEPALRVSPVKGSFNGAAERVVFKVQAWKSEAEVGAGTVHLVSTVGTFVKADVELVEGFVTATFSCDPDVEAACVGPIKISGEWNGITTSTQVVGLAPGTVSKVKWEVVPTGVASSIHALERSAAGRVLAVGDDGRVLELNGRSWTSLPTDTIATLRALAFDSTGAPIVVGDGVIIRWHDGAPTVSAVADTQFTAVTFDANDRALIGTQSGRVVSWNEVEGVVPSVDFEAPVLAMTNRDGVAWAMTEGALAHFETTWSMVTSPFTGSFATLRAGRNALLIGGQRQGASSVTGVLAEGPPDAWTTTQFNSPVRSMTEVPMVSERFALTSTGLWRQLDMAAWEQVDVPSSAVSLISRGAGDLVLVGPPGISLLRVP